MIGDRNFQFAGAVLLICPEVKNVNSGFSEVRSDQDLIVKNRGRDTIQIPSRISFNPPLIDQNFVPDRYCRASPFDERESM